VLLKLGGRSTMRADLTGLSTIFRHGNLYLD